MRETIVHENVYLSCGEVCECVKKTLINSFIFYFIRGNVKVSVCDGYVCVVNTQQSDVT